MDTATNPTTTKTAAKTTDICTCGHAKAAHSMYGDHGCLADVGAATDPNPRGCHCERYAASL